MSVIYFLIRKFQAFDRAILFSSKLIEFNYYLWNVLTIKCQFVHSYRHYPLQKLEYESFHAKWKNDYYIQINDSYNGDDAVWYKFFLQCEYQIDEIL